MEMVKGMDTTGIAIENHCAIIYKDDGYKVISSREQAKAYKIQEINQQMIVTEIEEHAEYNEIVNM
ncbi:hypothetical protein [Paenibacillus sp. FSL R7-0333]|uniref:hypothetical protein n=1 Tax=Paenibacillus sp. FSL R7-0333 TaxID=1926587 RepID=UPI0026BC193D